MIMVWWLKNDYKTTSRPSTPTPNPILHQFGKIGLSDYLSFYPNDRRYDGGRVSLLTKIFVFHAKKWQLFPDRFPIKTRLNQGNTRDFQVVKTHTLSLV